jgi:hypothetical protein
MPEVPAMSSEQIGRYALPPRGKLTLVRHVEISGSDDYEVASR